MVPCLRSMSRTVSNMLRAIFWSSMSRSHHGLVASYKTPRFMAMSPCNPRHPLEPTDYQDRPGFSSHRPPVPYPAYRETQEQKLRALQHRPPTLKPRLQRSGVQELEDMHPNHLGSCHHSVSRCDPSTASSDGRLVCTRVFNSASC